MRDSNVLIQVVLSSLSRADIAILSELKRKYPDLSRAALKVLFREKRVKLVTKPRESNKSGPTDRPEALDQPDRSGDRAGAPIRTLGASDDLFPGTHLIEILDWNPSADLAPEPTQGPDTERLPVLFEDEDLLILHKSSGTPSVPLKSFETKTAVSSALQHLERSGQTSLLQAFLQIGKSSGHPLEAGLLHRLDTGTSGVLAFATNQAEFDRIRSLWKTTQVRKFYRAIVQMTSPNRLINRQSDWQPDLAPKTPLFKLDRLPFLITTPIGHDAKSSKRMLVIQTPKDERTIRGKPLEAITHILSARPIHPASLVSRQNSLRGSTQLLDLQIEIETGVMHQIRVHLASVGLPILGDPLYGNAPTDKKTSGETISQQVPHEELHTEGLITIPRLYLHHERLELPLRSGATLSVHAKSDFERLS